MIYDVVLLLSVRIVTRWVFLVRPRTQQMNSDPSKWHAFCTPLIYSVVKTKSCQTASYFALKKAQELLYIPSANILSPNTKTTPEWCNRIARVSHHPKITSLNPDDATASHSMTRSLREQNCLCSQWGRKEWRGGILCPPSITFAITNRGHLRVCVAWATVRKVEVGCLHLPRRKQLNSLHSAWMLAVLWYRRAAWKVVIGHD